MQTATSKIWSETHRQRLDSALAELKDLLLTPRTYVRARSLVSGWLAESPFGFKSKEELKERITDPEVLKKLPISWPHLKKDFRTIVTTAESVDPVEIAMAFFERGYLCFHTALFWNGMSDQVPKNFFVATERKTPIVGGDSSDIDDFSMQDAFMKPPRETRKVGHFENFRFTLIERDHTGYLGVMEKKVAVSGGTARVRYTDVERTLIDAAIHPQRCGGILNVINAFRTVGRKKFRTRKLIEYYGKLDPVYPYWQRIGLILKISENSSMEKLWRAHFGEPSRRFFLDRPYKTDWPVEESWKVAYPLGLGR